jgi:transcriptional repressor NrdR
MANFVIKKDGGREPFDPEKVKNSVRMATTGIITDPQEIEQLVEGAAGAALALAATKEEIATGEIKSAILGRLDKIAPNVAVAWRAYDGRKAKGQD